MENLTNIFNVLIIEKMWENLEFWQILFLTVVISLFLVKLSAFIDRKAGVFQKFKQHDLAIYKKTSNFFSENEILTFLNDLKEKQVYRKTVLQQISDFESLMSSPSNLYKSDILKTKVDLLLKDIKTLKHFLIVNFAEEKSSNVIAEPLLTLLPETRSDLSADKEALLELDESAKEEASRLFDEKNKFYFQKERELKELVETVLTEYNIYRDIIKRYLNV